MRVQLENEYVIAQIESAGAELKSLQVKSNNREIMWEADPKFWGKTSPILFPAIGKFNEGKYRLNGKEFELIKHGFARDYDYKVVITEKERAVFEITSNEDTMKSFPFEFILRVEYKLEEASIREIWHLENKSKDTMYFSFGGHPAFATPQIIDGTRTGNRNDTCVKLYSRTKADTATCTEINVKTGLLTGNSYTLEAPDGIIPIRDGIFDNDALVLEKQGIMAIGLLDKDGKEMVRLEAPTCPVWGVWSMPATDAAYICIEPWWGICDCAGYTGEFKDRPYMNRLLPGNVWTEGFRIIPG